MRTFVPALFVLLVMTGCAAQGSGAVGDTGGTRPSLDSGIRGVTVAGPQCPVEIAGSPCPDKPLAAAFDVQAPNGDVVAHARSGDDGKFLVVLQPGHYVVNPGPPASGPFPVGKPVDVVVRPHRFTRVTVTYDTGIR
jgi:hypothetical protein